MARINGLLPAVGLALLLLVLPLAAAQHGRRAATVKVLASSTPLLTKSTPMSSPQYAGGRPKPDLACSCAHPTPLPVGPAFEWLRQQDARITGEEDARSTALGKQQQQQEEEEVHVERSGHHHHDGEAEDRLAHEDACRECNELPRARRGGMCGATLGICGAVGGGCVCRHRCATAAAPGTEGSRRAQHSTRPLTRCRPRHTVLRAGPVLWPGRHLLRPSRELRRHLPGGLGSLQATAQRRQPSGPRHALDE
jgi:hypothetical protein